MTTIASLEFKPKKSWSQNQNPCITPNYNTDRINISIYYNFPSTVSRSSVASQEVLSLLGLMFLEGNRMRRIKDEDGILFYHRTRYHLRLLSSSFFALLPHDILAYPPPCIYSITATSKIALPVLLVSVLRLHLYYGKRAERKSVKKNVRHPSRQFQLPTTYSDLHSARPSPAFEKRRS